MKSKPFDKCKVFGCTRATWSGKPEADIELRHCPYHSPAHMKRQKVFGDEKRAMGNLKEVKTKVNPFALPLVCVFKEYRVVYGKGKRRVVFTSDVCAEKAARCPKRPSTPKYQNRHGDPLCAKHAKYALNVDAFPDTEHEAPLLSLAPVSEALKAETALPNRPRVNHVTYVSTEKVARDLDFLVGEATALLEHCNKNSLIPHLGTVHEMRDRLNRLRRNREQSLVDSRRYEGVSFVPLEKFMLELEVLAQEAIDELESGIRVKRRPRDVAKEIRVKLSIAEKCKFKFVDVFVPGDLRELEGFEERLGAE